MALAEVESAMARYAEIAALTVIALLVAGGGRVLLAEMATERTIAAMVIAALIVIAVIGLRRTYRMPGNDARLAITKSVAYLVAAGLALVDVLAPMKWVPGSCIAAAVVAIVFDIITIATRPRASEGT